jgi:hypothetical protein
VPGQVGGRELLVRRALEKDFRSIQGHRPATAAGGPCDCVVNARDARLPRLLRDRWASVKYCPFDPLPGRPRRFGDSQCRASGDQSPPAPMSSKSVSGPGSLAAVAISTLNQFAHFWVYALGWTILRRRSYWATIGHPHAPVEIHFVLRLTPQPTQWREHPGAARAIQLSRRRQTGLDPNLIGVYGHARHVGACHPRRRLHYPFTLAASSPQSYDEITAAAIWIATRPSD